MTTRLVTASGGTIRRTVSTTGTIAPAGEADTTSRRTVHRDGKAATQRVTPGLVGTQFDQVKSEVSAGDRVVLADLGAAIPSSDSNDTRHSSRSAPSPLSGSGSGPGAGGGGPPGR